VLKRVAHIGIAVKSINEAVRLFCNILGLKLKETQRIEELGLNIAFLKLGDVDIELLESVRNDTPIAKFIEKRGEGIHHICIEVDDIEKTISNLSQAGIELIDKEPRIGTHKEKIAFINPKSTGGVLIELEEAEK